MWRNFAKALLEMQRSVAKGGASYRPDLHYMRGPGPKWHAKYGYPAPKASAAAAPASPALRETVEHHA